MSGVIIKAGQTRTMAQGLLGLSLRDIADKADAVLAAARAEAARLVEQATRDAETRRRELFEQARRDGLAQGLAEGRREGFDAALKEARTRFDVDSAELSRTLPALADEIVRRREQLYAAARRDVVVLAVAIAGRVVARWTALNDTAPEAAVQACDEALAFVAEASDVTIRVHPADASAVELLAGETSSALNRGRHLRIVEDESIERGGVRIETADTQVDAQAATRVDRIADELVTDWRKRMKELSLA